LASSSKEGSDFLAAANSGEYRLALEARALRGLTIFFGRRRGVPLPGVGGAAVGAVGASGGETSTSAMVNELM